MIRAVLDAPPLGKAKRDVEALVVELVSVAYSLLDVVTENQTVDMRQVVITADPRHDHLLRLRLLHHLL